MRTQKLRALVVALACAAPWSAAAEPKDPPPSSPALRPFYDYPFGPATEGARTLTVEEAIAAALAQTSPLRQVQIEEQVATEDVRQAHATFLPQIAAPLAYFGTTPAAGTDPRLPSYAPSIGIHETSVLVAAGGALDLSGGLRAGARRAQEALSAARAGTEAARRDLVLATIDAYYGLALSRQKRRLADETLAIAEGFAEIAAEQSASGEAGAPDEHRARAEALKRRDELEQARASESAAADLLRTLTGVPPSVYIQVSRLGPELPPLAGLDRYTEEVVDSRPQLRQIDALARAATEEERAARAERRPQLAYTLTAGFDAIDLGDLRRYSGASALLGLRVPIFDFGASRSRQAQAGLRREGFEALHDSTRRALRQEFYSARALAFSARERLADARERADESEKSLKLLTNRFRRHKATMTEVVDAQSAHAEARTAYYQAIADLSTARVRLETDPARADFTTAAAAPPGAPPAAACAAGRERAPEISGLRLGLTVAEVRRRFPGLEEGRLKKSGLLLLKLEEADLAALPAADDPAFTPTKVALRFFEDRLYYFRVSYYRAPWTSLGEFLTREAERLGLPGAWIAFYDWRLKTLRDAEDLGDMALECDGFRVRVGIGIEGVQGELKPHVKVEDTSVLQRIRAREAEDARADAEAEADKPEKR